MFGGFSTRYCSQAYAQARVDYWDDHSQVQCAHAFWSERDQTRQLAAGMNNKHKICS